MLKWDSIMINIDSYNITVDYINIEFVFKKNRIKEISMAAVAKFGYNLIFERNSRFELNMTLSYIWSLTISYHLSSVLYLQLINKLLLKTIVSGIQRISLASNNIRTLPDEIGNCCELQELYLSNNSKLSSIPSSAGHLRCVRSSSFLSLSTGSFYCCLLECNTFYYIRY